MPFIFTSADIVQLLFVLTIMLVKCVLLFFLVDRFDKNIVT